MFDIEFESSQEKLRKTLITENEKEYQVFVDKQELIDKYDNVIKKELTLASDFFSSTLLDFPDIEKKISYQRYQKIIDKLSHLSLFKDGRYK